MQKRVTSVELQRFLQLLLRLSILSGREKIHCQIFVRRDQGRIHGDRSFVFLVCVLNASQFRFCYSDQIHDGGVARPLCLRSAKLGECAVIVPLAKIGRSLREMNRILREANDWPHGGAEENNRARVLHGATVPRAWFWASLAF